MKAKITIHKDYIISSIDKRLYGSFLEHLGRAIYEGIYEPNHPSSNSKGYRMDVMETIKDLDMPVIRYPGGNFVSAFNWEDSVGPKKLRPKRIDLAWKTTETNEFGLNEFMDWSKEANTEAMMAINLGSRGVESAVNLVEYCNHPSGSYWSDLRVSHGYKEPHNIKMWCLGNEMDGPWQVGHKTAYEYGRLANETAKALRKFDNNLELIVCGSSNDRMKTYPDWEAEVLDQSYDSVDYISLHQYWDNYENDTASYLANTVVLDTYLKTVESVITYIKSKKRSKKDIKISFDEWNPWYHTRSQNITAEDELDLTNANWPEAPHLYEEMYNIQDALLVGSVLNSFINNSHIVKIACMAQLVNVIGAISTVTGGISWKQSIYYPLYFASKYGRGEAMNIIIDSPKYSCKIADDVNHIDASCVLNASKKELIFFIINKNLKESIDIDFNIHGIDLLTIEEQQSLFDEDLYASNTAENPNRIIPKNVSFSKLENNTLVTSLPKLSYNIIRCKMEKK